jgi:hypothetical protein
LFTKYRLELDYIYLWHSLKGLTLRSKGQLKEKSRPGK